MLTTLAQFRLQARERTQMVKSRLVSETELTTYINASIKELYDVLVSRFEDYYLKDTLAVIMLGSDAILLPSDFYKLKGVDFEESPGIFRTISAFQFNERNNFGTLGQGPTGSRVRYRILGQNLKMIPNQDAPGTYRIWYVPTFSALINETDSFDDLNGFGEYVVVDCAIKMLAKEESSTTEFVRQKTALINRIEAMAASRDAGEPQTIIDIGQVSFNQRRAF